MIKTIAKIVTFLFLPFLGYGFGAAVYQAVALSIFPKQNLIAFGIGFILFAVFWRVSKRSLQVVCTFEHELTHLLFGLLFLKRPHSFVVTRHDGGYVELSGGNFLITLAPYFFPTVSYLLLLLLYFVPKNSMPLFIGLLGASVAFHLASTWAEIHWRQTDLHEAGILFSLIFLPVANLIFYGALTSLIFGGADAFLKFWTIGVRESFILFSTLFR